MPVFLKLKASATALAVQRWTKLTYATLGFVLEFIKRFEFVRVQICSSHCSCEGVGVPSFINFVNTALQHKLHARSLGEPAHDICILFQQVEIFRRTELHSDAFGVRHLLDFGIDPLLTVLEEGFSGDET